VAHVSLIVADGNTVQEGPTTLTQKMIHDILAVT